MLLIIYITKNTAINAKIKAEQKKIGKKIVFVLMYVNMVTISNITVERAGKGSSVSQKCAPAIYEGHNFPDLQISISLPMLFQRQAKKIISSL